MITAIIARRIGLRSFALETADEGVFRISAWFFRTGGPLNSGTAAYTCTNTATGWVLQPDGTAETYATTRTGIGTWKLVTPTGAFQLRQGSGRTADVTNNAGDMVATISQSGVASQSLAGLTNEVTTPIGLLALLTIMARRRKKARVVAVVR